jgi:hypothetical protein
MNAKGPPHLNCSALLQAFQIGLDHAGRSTHDALKTVMLTPQHGSEFADAKEKRSLLIPNRASCNRVCVMFTGPWSPSLARAAT